MAKRPENRRGVGHFVLVCLAAFWAAYPTSFSCAGSKAEVATTFQINPAHSGAIDFAAGFKAPLKQLWARTFSGNTSYPVIADGRVFLVVQDADNYTLQLYALKLTNGKVLWTAPINGMFWSAPTYGNGKVFVLNDDGEFVAFEAATGKAVWTDELGTSGNAAPNAYGNKVYVQGSGGDDAHLFAIDQLSGRILWTSPDFSASQDSPTIGDGALFNCDANRFSFKGGSVVWRYPYGCASPGETAVYFDKRLYVRGDGNGNVVLGADQGTPLANFGGDAAPAFFTATGGKEYGVTLTDGQMYCFSTKTGDVKWSFAGDGARRD